MCAAIVLGDHYDCDLAHPAEVQQAQHGALANRLPNASDSDKHQCHSQALIPAADTHLQSTSLY